MKITVLSHMYPQPGREHYGIFVHEGLRELARRGHDIHVVAPLPHTPPRFVCPSSEWRGIASLPKRRTLDGIAISHPRYLLWPRNFDFAGAAGRMAKSVLAAGIPHCDILHAHAGIPDGGAARRISAATGTPYIVTSHGSDVLRMSGLSSRCYEEIRSAFASAEAVIYPSGRAKERAAERNLPTANASVIWNGFDKERFLAESAVSNPGEPLRLIAVANLVPSKRIDLLLAACAWLKEADISHELNVVGSGGEEGTLRGMAADLDLNVTWTASLGRDELAAALRASDLFVLPAEGESFGIVYLEAMAAGLAVIAIEGEGIADIIDHDRSGLLLPPGDPEAIAAAVTSLASDPERRQALGTAAIAKAAKLSWDRHAEQLELLYMKVLESGSKEAVDE